MDGSASLLQRTLSLIAALGISLGLIAYNLIVITKVWGLILVPMGAPTISLKQAIGLSLFSALFKSTNYVRDTETPSAIKLFSYFLSTSLIWGLTHLLFG